MKLPPDRFVLLQDEMKLVPAHHHQLAVLKRRHRARMGFAAEQVHLPEIIPGLIDRLLPAPAAHFEPSFGNHIETVRPSAFRDNDIPFVYFPPDRDLGKTAQLRVRNRGPDRRLAQHRMHCADSGRERQALVKHWACRGKPAERVLLQPQCRYLADRLGTRSPFFLKKQGDLPDQCAFAQNVQRHRVADQIPRNDLNLPAHDEITGIAVASLYDQRIPVMKQLLMHGLDGTFQFMQRHPAKQRMITQKLHRLRRHLHSLHRRKESARRQIPLYSLCTTLLSHISDDAAA